MNRFWILCLSAIVFISCKKDSNNILYELLDKTQSGIDFENNLSYNQDFNVYKYRNYYNGGGVAMGDINNDGLIDVYLTANQKKNKLYLNKGDFKFEDISEFSNSSGQKAWSTGVTMVDINNDGFLDIYVCNSGDIKGDNKQNELFINNGDLTFTESAKNYNLDDLGYSTHAAFFDYDKDGDLDVYILNNSYQAIGTFNLRRNERPKRDELGGDKLMENRGGQFVDVTEEAGIYGSVIGFGLGVTIGDVNNDGWEDIFISNDFFERDYLYINQKNGSFNEDLTSQMNSISGASMGADMSDIDNDGFNDIFVTEMLPSEYSRLKTVTTFEDWNKYQYMIKNGYHHQFTRNMLHYNNGNNSFSEIGRFSGVDASDWSWGALIYDMDNDGFKDLFISNGIYRDLTNQDYLQYISNEEVIRSMVVDKKVNYKNLIDIIPSNKVKNHAYKNQDGLKFKSFDDSGLQTPSFSNGSAYGDLDNDGDLDLIVNNVNMPVFVYKNTLDTVSSNFIKIDLKGNALNKFAIGSKVEVILPDGNSLFQEVQPARGFQSSVDIRPNFGLGNIEQFDLKVTWPDRSVTNLENIKSNQILKIYQSESNIYNDINNFYPLSNVFENIDGIVDYNHKENLFVDFNRERLIYHMCSNEGPNLTLNDINSDGKNDLLIPGSKGQLSVIYLSTEKGFTLDNRNNDTFKKYLNSENTKSIFFDADNDGDLDLYLASGGSELSPYSELLYDTLLFNDGTGLFNPSIQKLPNSNNKISTGAVISADIDNDGDLDLFVGERIKIGRYGAPCSGYVLINDGNGIFTDMTAKWAPFFKEMGLITDAQFNDFDGDNDQDLIIAGEFMGIEIYENDGNQFIKNSSLMNEDLKGWWNKLHLEDLDNDGDMDIIAGNHGENSRFKASMERPIKLYYNDFDRNGSEEGVLTFNASNGKDYPYALRHNLIDQMKILKKKFPNFESFKDADISKIFNKDELENATISEVNNLQTTILINNGKLRFNKITLPKEVQFSPIYAINSADFDNDGDKDILMGGNLFNAKPEVGIYDASYGIYLENLGDNKFKYIKNGNGFFVKGEVRDIVIDENFVIVARNSDNILTFKFNK